MAFRVANAKHAFDRAIRLRATPVANPVGPIELNIPAIEWIGGSLHYLDDRYGDQGTIYGVDFRWAGEPEPKPEGALLRGPPHP
jgi:4-hydroxyphenylpyruvate dioxygenase